MPLTSPWSKSNPSIALVCVYRFLKSKVWWQNWGVSEDDCRVATSLHANKLVRRPCGIRFSRKGGGVIRFAGSSMRQATEARRNNRATSQLFYYTRICIVSFHFTPSHLCHSTIVPIPRNSKNIARPFMFQAFGCIFFVTLLEESKKIHQRPLNSPFFKFFSTFPKVLFFIISTKNHHHTIDASSKS
jgi:hypothetical protein